MQSEQYPLLQNTGLTLPRLAKHLLLCHAKTVDLYRREFQPTEKGTIGNARNPAPLNCHF
jgi:hypothetical protein